MPKVCENAHRNERTVSSCATPCGTAEAKPVRHEGIRQFVERIIARSAGFTPVEIPFLHSLTI